MKNHRKNIVSSLRNSSRVTRVLFGLFATERLRVCCWVAHSGTEIWHKYLFALEQGFSMVLNKTEKNNSEIQILIDELQDLVPDGGEPLRVQGQSSVVCLIETLMLFLEYDEQSVETLINSMADALDNYFFYIHRIISGDLISPGNYYLLDRELKKQLDDIDFLDKSPTLEKIEHWRIENLEYSVPVAVG